LQEASKTLRIGVVNLLSTAGMAIGTALSGVSFKTLGFYGVYAVSAAVYALGLAYGAASVPEVSAGAPRTGDRPGGGPCGGFFDARHVTEAFGVTFKDGPRNRRLRVVMLMCVAFLVMGPLNGSCAGVQAFLRVAGTFFVRSPPLDKSVLSTYGTFFVCQRAVGRMNGSERSYS